MSVSEIFEVFVKMVQLYVLNDADHFKLKKTFSIFEKFLKKLKWKIF